MIQYSVSWSSKPHAGPKDPLAIGLAAHLRGDLEQAIAEYASALRARPNRILAAYNLGVALIDSGYGLSSIPLLARAVRQWPSSSVLRAAWLYALLRSGRQTEAERCLAEAERLGFPQEVLRRWQGWLDNPDPERLDAEARPTPARPEREPPDAPLALPTQTVVHQRLQETFVRWLGLYQSGQWEGLACELDQALAEQPSWGEAHHLRGLVARAQNDLKAARLALERAIELVPGRAEIWDHLGVVYSRLGDPIAAQRAFEESLCLNPLRAETWNNAADAALRAGALEAAFQYAHQSLRLDPQLLLAGYSLLQAAYKLLERDRPDREPADDHNGPLAFAASFLGERIKKPEQALRLAGWLVDLGRFEDAVRVLERGHSLPGPQPPELLSELISAKLYACHWQGLAERCAALIDRVRHLDHCVARPFVALAIPGLTAADQQRVARLFAEAYYTPWSARASNLPPAPARPKKGRLRIGYLSDDLQEHATAYLTASVFEHHDRRRFEVFAYSTGADDGGLTRRRLKAAIEHFIDIRELNHDEAARRIRLDGIDILVDLKGYTRHARIEILAQRPAPIQVTWLGFPGGLGAPFIDYLIADSTVIPPEHLPYYNEAIAYLPDAYAPVDERRIVGRTPTRAEMGLPEEALVFVCFNEPYKITPQIFDRWCRILQAVPGSVLWLYARLECVRQNLREEARRRGIDPSRLIFAGKLPQPEHLARIPLADLMLDTLPVNAHTTASDALWMGVPIVTCLGDTFAGRVAASLLRACGLDELVTTGLDDYEGLAVALARDPARLQALRERLQQAKRTAPFFDSRSFTRHLEALYERMWERHREGLAPARLDPLALR